jgi:hypothetical protein
MLVGLVGCHTQLECPRIAGEESFTEVADLLLYFSDFASGSKPRSLWRAHCMASKTDALIDQLRGGACDAGLVAIKNEKVGETTADSTLNEDSKITRL